MLAEALDSGMKLCSIVEEDCQREMIPNKCFIHCPAENKAELINF